MADAPTPTTPDYSGQQLTPPTPQDASGASQAAPQPSSPAPAPSTPQTAPPAPAPATPAVPTSTHGDLALTASHGLLNALLGPTSESKYNSKTGTLDTVPVSTSTRATRFLGKMLAGTAQGIGVPGRKAGEAAGRSFDVVNKLNQDQRENQLDQANMYESHLKQLVTLRNLSTANQAEQDQMVVAHKNALDYDTANSTSELTDPSKSVSVTEGMKIQQEFLKANPQYKNTDIDIQPSGVIPHEDPNNPGTVLKDKDGANSYQTTVRVFVMPKQAAPITPEQQSYYKSKVGYEPTPNMSNASRRSLDTSISSSESAKIIISRQAPTADSSVLNDVSNQRSLDQINQAFGKDQTPKTAYESLLAAHNTTAAGLLVSLYGGIDNIGTVSAKIAGDRAASEAGLKAEAEAKARVANDPTKQPPKPEDITSANKDIDALPYLTTKEKQTFKDNASRAKTGTALTKEVDFAERQNFSALQKKMSDNNSAAIRDSAKSTAQAKEVADSLDNLSWKGKGNYKESAAINNEFAETLQAVQNGDQVAAAFARTQGIQNVNNVAQLSRIPPTEYASQDEAGSYKRQIANLIAKHGSGTMSADSIKELKGLQARLQDTQYNGYVGAVKNSLSNRGVPKTDGITVLAPDGVHEVELSKAWKSVTAKAPQGAKGWITDGDGLKTGYIGSDGKRVNL
jgi:hypothetical protein